MKICAKNTYTKKLTEAMGTTLLQLKLSRILLTLAKTNRVSVNIYVSIIRTFTIYNDYGTYAIKDS